MPARGQTVRRVAAAAVMAMAAAGCASSGSRSATTNAARPPAGGPAVLSTAYSRAVAAKSAKLNLNVSVSSAGKTTVVTGAGAFDWARRLGQMTVQPAGQPTSLTEVLDGADLYIQVPGPAAAQLGKPWLKIDVSGMANSGAYNDPAQTLAVLESSSGGLANLGPQVIGGIPTTHYRAQVDPSRAAANAPPAAKRLLAQLPALTGGSTFPVEVWVDGQGRPRQISYTITLQRPPAGSPPAAAQAFPETTVMTMGLSGYGTPVNVTVPPPDQVRTQSIPGLTSPGSASPGSVSPPTS